MQVLISGHHFNMSDRIKSYIEKELTRLERFYTPILNGQVTITQENRTLRASVVVRVHAQKLTAVHEADKVYAAVDGVMDKMARQLKKLHGKRRRLRPGRASSVVRSETEE